MGKVTCPFSTCANDEPTKVAHLGWRFLITLIAWIVLGIKVDPGTGFFTSLILFSLPLVLDYWKFRPTTKERIYMRVFGIFLAVIWGLIGIFGLSGVFNIEKTNDILLFIVSQDFIVQKGESLTVSCIWYSIALSVAWTGIDWFVYDSPFESNLISDAERRAQ